MNLTPDLGEFNRRLVTALAGTFGALVEPMQSEDGTLLFRGPIPGESEPSHVGTHVAVSLEKEVKAALDAVASGERDEMMENLINNLSTQVKARYDPTNIGPFALEFVGTMRIVRG
jgi:hypothetical protein